MSLVRCRCGAVVDLMDVHVTGRFADCSVFKMPCCGIEADDRKGIHQPYTWLPDDVTPGGWHVCPNGMMVHIPEVTR